jgi:PAS domain S-box-containing protein
MTAPAHGAESSHDSLNLRDLIETIPALVVCALPDGSAELTNRAWQEYTGHTPEQLSGKGWQAVIHPDDLARLMDAWGTALAAGKPFEAEARLQSANGKYRWFLIRKALAVARTQDSRGSLRSLIACEDIHERKQAQAKLQQSETRLEAFLENSPNLIFMKDRQGRYLYSNKEFGKAFRVRGEQIIGKTDSDVLSPEQAKAFQASDRQVLETGAPMEFEISDHQDDGLHTRIVQNFPLFDVEGQICSVAGIATDITERIRQESARRFSEERHRLVMESASDSVVSVDESGIIRFANRATDRIFGYEPAELIGKPLIILMPELMRDAHTAGFQRYLVTGQRHMNWQGMELLGLRKNGQEFAIEVSFGELSDNGQRVFTGFIRDISERKLAQDKLRASERSLRELTETIPQMLWSADADGSINYCNQRVLDYTGLSAAEVRGGHWMKAVHHDDTGGMAEAWSRAVSTGEPFQYEFRCFRISDHSYRWCISRAVPLRDQDNRVIRWYGTVVDLHDWREAQQALQITQAELARVSRLTTMGELAASIAHEVNQPLTAVTNNSSACLRLLANHNLEPEVLHRTLEEIIADATRASAVIARIRAFIKKRPAENTQLDVNELIQEVLGLLVHELQNNKIRLDCQLTKALPPVLGDRVQVQQVLLNLIMNGIEAMSTVTDRPRQLSVQSRTDSSGEALIAVADSGIGLGREEDRLFSPFFTTKANGMGMGLTISRSLIEAHGGRLWAAPNDPEGAVFSFTLPVEVGSAS